MSEMEIGSVIRDYEIVKRIGRGAMGQVYQVRHRLLGFERAMKLLRPDQLEATAARERFLREAALLSSFHHPNIVAFHEFGSLDDGTQFLVMEHLRGAVLWRRLSARGPLPVSEAVAAFIGICHGLAEAHRRGVVHRDVSADNIFFAITPAGEVAKLIDFGIALPADTDTFSRLTQAGMFLGKCAYAAPEQLGIGNKTGGFDARADLYALGVVLYEALSGKNPFGGANLAQIIELKMAGRPAPLREVAPDRAIPAVLDDLIQSILDPDVDKRPQSADAVRLELEKIQRIINDQPPIEVEIRPAPSATSAQLDLNTQVGEYTIEGVLGQGGMGTVYQARHRLLGVTRALKLVNPKWVRDASQRERFLREARLLAQLEHPNLVKVYDISPLAEGAYYMVQELVDGESLRDRLKRKGRLSPAVAIPLFAAAARGLHACHRAGVVHRDISPDNLMVVSDSQGDETVKIIDFGIAKSTLSAEDAGITSTRTFIGKLEYCSPEQAGKLEPNEDIDGRSDIYSLGVVLYQSLVGKLPFFADTPQGYLAKHLTAAPPAPASLGVVLPPGLESLLLQMLDKERDKRPSSASELALLLERSVHDDDVAALPTIAVSRQELGRARASKGPMFGIAAAVIVAALAAIFAIRGKKDGSTPTTAVAVPPTVVATPTSASSPPAPPTPTITATPDARDAVRRLLAEGAAMLARERMTVPAGESALDRYRQVLAIEPQNADAKHGLEQIRDYYIARGDELRDGGKAALAKDSYLKAQGVLADSVVASRLSSLSRLPAATPTPVVTATPIAVVATPEPTVGLDAVAVAWLGVKRAPSTASVTAFLAAHPRLAPALDLEARALLVQLTDEDAFRALDRLDRQSLDGYLAAFPQGRHQNEVKRLLGQLEQDVRDAFAVADRENTAAAYARFLSMHPNAPADLRQRATEKELAITNQDDEAFRKARREGTIAAFLGYIEKYPRGRNIAAALELFNAPKQGVLALKLVRGVSARDATITLPKELGERQAMDFLGGLGIVPCDGVWDEAARLTPDDFRCIANVDPRVKSEPYVIDIPSFAKLVKARLSKR